MKNMSRYIASFFLAFSIVGCASTSQTLAPSGKLRVGMYPGSPTSIIPGPTPAENRGVGYDLGQELAKKIQVGFEPVVFQKNADVLAAVKAGQVDVTFTNATEARKKDMDFSATFLRVEQGYLLGPNSRIKSMDDVDKAGVKIGVSSGSTSESVLGKQFKNAKLVKANSLKQAEAMLKSKEIDAFATNKAILNELSDQVPGSLVLKGAWGYENFAIGIPKGREAGLPVLNDFINQAKSNGQIDAAVKRSGLRGVAPN